MGGFTEIFLRDKSEENIKKQNALLKQHGVPKRYRFYSEDDIIFEYESFEKGLGVFPEHLFPKHKINSYYDFKHYWSPKALGSCFVPYIGSLTFDCYYDRTSKRAMRNIGRYLGENFRAIEKTSGSFSTFMERGMTKLERQLMVENRLD